MKAKVIKTSGDYALTLERIDVLMDAPPGTNEAEELELLAVLVEKFEENQFPAELPDPIDAIKFRMDQLSLKQKDLIPTLGSASRVSEVLSGKRSLSLKMIRALNSELGIPAEVLLQEQGQSIPNQESGLEWQRFPVWEMSKRGWLEGIESAARAKDLAEDFMRPFLEPLLAHGLSDLKCRVGERETTQTNREYSLLAWTARVVAICEYEPLTQFESGTVDRAFMSHLVQLSQYDNGPLLAQDFLHQHGIQFVVEGHLRGTQLDGAVLMLSSGNPVVALTLRHDRLDYFWFTLCHELGHIALHLDGVNHIFDQEIDISIDDPESIEGQANTFAQNAIIPPDIWTSSSLSSRPSRKEVYSVAKKIFVNPALVAGRVRKETENYKLFSNMLGRGGLRKLFGAVDVE